MCAGRLREALPFLEEMRLLGHRADTFTYNIALRSCAGKVISHLLFVSTRALTGSIRHFLQADWQRANALMSEMDEMKVPPTVDSFTALVGACVKVKDAKRAVALLEKMGAYGLEPDLPTFNNALRASVERDPLRAVGVLDRMRLNNMKGDKTTTWAVCRLNEVSAAMPQSYPRC